MQTDRRIEDVAKPYHPIPERAAELPYSPAIHVSGPADMVFLSGMTAAPLYHSHPHIREEHFHAPDIETQARRAMDKIKMILEGQGLTLRNIAKMTKYLTDMRDQEGVSAVMREYFGDWKPASTTVSIHSLNQPGARIEIDVIAVKPR